MNCSNKDLSWLEINLEAIQHNAQVIQKLVNKPIMAVLKANAYGLGAGEVARALSYSGMSNFAVARISEANTILQFVPEAKILILGPISPSDFNKIKSDNIALTVHSLNYLSFLKNNLPNKNYKIHIKIDTGFNRLGFSPSDAIEKWNVIFKSGFQIEGIFSHFSMIDQFPQHPKTEHQLRVFINLLDELKSKFCLPPLIHFSNSAVAFGLPDAYFSIVRVGSALLGLKPFYYAPLPEQLKRTFEWHSRLVSCKKVRAGSFFGYGEQISFQDDTWIGIVSTGYGDGYRQSNKNYILIEGNKYPVVGRINCDFLYVKLQEPFPEGTKVTLLGHQGESEIWLDDLYEAWNTSQAEAITTLTDRVTRYYYN